MLILNARMRMVDQVAFGLDGRLYAAGTWYGDLRYRRQNRGIDVWELAGSADPIGCLFPDRIVNGFVLNPAGRWLYASADRELYQSEDQGSGYFAVDLRDGQPVWLGMQSWNTFRMAIHPSGEWFVGFGCIGNWMNKRVVRWSQPSDGFAVREWEKPPSLENELWWQIACDAHRDRLMSMEVHNPVPNRFETLLVGRTASDWTITEKVTVTAKTVEQLRVAPDGSCLVARNAASLLVWNPHDLVRKPRKIRGGKLHFTGITFHPSGRYLATTSNDKTVKLYDTTTWEVARTFTWDIGKMRSIAFSPDGTLAAAGSDTGKVVVWDVDL